MKIKFVTLTGADDKTSIEGMLQLSQKFHFAEWAILFSQSKAGVPRYPSLDWVNQLLASEGTGNFAAHLCGKWVDDAQRGRLTFLDDDEVSDFFGRIQLNMAGSRLEKCLNFENKVWECDFSLIPVIFGGPYSKYNLAIPTDKFRQLGVSPLFDASGGRGISAKTWPTIPLDEYGKPLFCGYAGGLGPDNLEAELERISEVVGDAEIWIDMETKLRNDKDEFDLTICERILQIAEPWVS